VGLGVGVGVCAWVCMCVCVCVCRERLITANPPVSRCSSLRYGQTYTYIHTYIHDDACTYNDCVSRGGKLQIQGLGRGLLPCHLMVFPTCRCGADPKAYCSGHILVSRRIMLALGRGAWVRLAVSRPLARGQPTSPLFFFVSGPPFVPDPRPSPAPSTTRARGAASHTCQCPIAKPAGQWHGIE
jgi:hypothetical protein